MTWERRLLDLFDDLEQRAEGLALEARDGEVAELGRAEYSLVDLAARLHASVGAVVRVQVLGAGSVAGRLARVGDGWCLVADEDSRPVREWVVLLDAVVALRGLASGAVDESAQPLSGRLRPGSVLRALAEQQAPVLLLTRDGGQYRGMLGRVGADFLELVTEDRWSVQVRLDALAALSGR